MNTNALLATVLTIVIVLAGSCDSDSSDDNLTPAATPSPIIEETMEPPSETQALPVTIGAPSDNLTPAATPSPTPEETMELPSETQALPVTIGAPSCAGDIQALQTALDAYYRANWKWPTSTGGAGDIEWDELVPDYLIAVPLSNSVCDWYVNSAPGGTVCLLDKASKGSDCSCGSVCTQSTSESQQPDVAETEPAQCGTDREQIQAALDSYYAANGKWPTADGEPGLIVWDDVLVPQYLDQTPSTFKCKWQVNTEPMGTVCRSVHC